LALRVEETGSILFDYHTAQTPPARKGRRWATRRAELAEPGLGTILSRREYREGPRHTVVLWERAGARWPLQALAEALRRPRFTLYLGRKACPLGLPPAPRLIEAATLTEAFTRFDAERPIDEQRLHDRLGLSGGVPRVYAEVEESDRLGPGLRRDRIERRRDLLLSRRRWQFGLREEVVAEPAR
jgi:CRISPR system Cascade subunit CasD